MRTAQLWLLFFIATLIYFIITFMLNIYNPDIADILILVWFSFFVGWLWWSIEIRDKGQ